GKKVELMMLGCLKSSSPQMLREWKAELTNLPASSFQKEPTLCPFSTCSQVEEAVSHQTSIDRRLGEEEDDATH
ncbi:hypothetical protein HAX54_033434, partial [Datura stramonium]|nr:hypothetical protein [Datura stramonium]